MKVKINKVIKKEVDLLFYSFEEGDNTIIAATNFLEALVKYTEKIDGGIITYIDDLDTRSCNEEAIRFKYDVLQVKQIPLDEIDKMKVIDVNTGRQTKGNVLLKKMLKNENIPFVFSTTEY